ncbi:uncharacterized protein LOC105208444 isoform X1 [Zeugodacus cucurbitae]|uniref:uncharacterized protein LOC105208444 isoform X1 n=1 Tax=Zeugodacus cucurbitae TaxID=28588 RepID=UPI0023D8E665|nr:uncharacterized protein LOC105208444 isoform X1 [Zeugodacus cucurbitae]XP_054081675.1 uncharacterized protein LOC105208444 isoform X1 [Zeugodacus cucurbitae]XP_054081676.1 uncharacterized protein LOC105208444 isoform X1 [Zeugodacus cucurbitae]XP_054081677.1 uncharacterized protein LOC105208444 isoform X1 [Zeugodacus cucurbitae]XP_054081678.1 uncharacterized protein LOC105208444 isoform X1 [Zeugodacus cucurbitae]XP_054081679.1 uncharacterized protein LOC105208444 isoform X1 [Zeugodacus cucur
MMLLPSGRSNSDRIPSPQLVVTGTNNLKILQTTASITSKNNGAVPTVDTKSLLPGNQSEIGVCCSARFNFTPKLPGSIGTMAEDYSILRNAESWEEIGQQLQALQENLKDDWTVHMGKEGRLYYCNHVAKISSWLPSSEDWSKYEKLPYGWERAIDSKGRSYYINHINKTSTYEAPENIECDGNPPEPRMVTLQRSPTLGFGFVAGSERPVIVRFVTDGGPSMNKLQPGDQILSVNGEDVKEAPRDHVIQLVRACESEVAILVCQPTHNLAPGRKSTLLSAGKRAKLRTRPSRVRFAESVCVNGSPLFPASAFSLGDICVPPMANVLKVFLENGQTKSFKYDCSTSVQDVVRSLLDKLCLSTGEIFSLVLEHVKSLKRNKLTLLDPEESLAQIAARPGAHKLRCLFRVTFVPKSAADLAQKDLNALDYLYMQCCNDVTQERFAPELQPEVALRLAALHMHQHALANNIAPTKLTVKAVEREFGLERFVPISLFEGMKRKELRRLISHFLKLNAEMTGSSTKVLTQLQAKLHYLDIISNLPSYGAKCFSTNQREGVERVLLISPRYGLSQIPSVRNSVPQPISAIEDFSHVTVNREDDVSCSVTIYMQGGKAVKFLMEDRDACEFSLVLAGYHRLLTGKLLTVERERDQHPEDNAPSYLTQHTVIPAVWSYLLPFHNRTHSITFLLLPPYHLKKDATILFGSQNQNNCSDLNSLNKADSNQNPKIIPFISNGITDLDIHSVMATELLEEAKDSSISDGSGGGSNNCDRLINLETNAFIEAKNVEVLRRVHEMQKLVENSEQYLNEQGEMVPESDDIKFNSSIHLWQNEPINREPNINKIGNSLDFDSDCDSMNSSKVSSTEDTPQLGALKHSDSLVLLAESINQDLNGITQSLNSIGRKQSDLSITISNISTCSPQPDRKFNNIGQILSDLQTSADFSQSESDSESVNSPTSSPIARRPVILCSNDRRNSHKQNLAYRSSFGLHSPDGNNFGSDNKDYNLKEYLKQLKEISNVHDGSQDTDVAAKKLSEIYGFEVHGDTFIATDTDLIDLRSIPPPRTPDELDAISLLNAAPQGFGDGSKNILTTNDESDLDAFLANIIVAPPAQRATPAKELTPEEIMSFIIPPPPDQEDNKNKAKAPTENLYSNSISETREHFNESKPLISENLLSNRNQLNKLNKCEEEHVIVYSTVERKGKFSCCPKCVKDNTENVSESIKIDLEVPPRFQSIDKPTPPERPPKSAELIQRYSPKRAQGTVAEIQNHDEKIKEQEQISHEERPPLLPPRVKMFNRLDKNSSTPSVSEAPQKPPLPPIANRSTQRNISVNVKDLNSESLSPVPPLIPQCVLPVSYPNLNSNYSCNMQHEIHPITIASKDNLPIKNYCPLTYLQKSTFDKSPPLSLLSSPQISRKIESSGSVSIPLNSVISQKFGEKYIIKNGHVIDSEALLNKTDIAMSGLLVKLDQVAAQCSAAQLAGGGANIDEDKFQRARNELTEQTLMLVTASKFLVVAMSDMTLSTLPEHLTSCLTAIRRITELTQDMTLHTSSPLQTRNIVLKVHDVGSSFRELVGVQIGPLGAGQLALQAECLANVLATLLRSLRVFSP